MQRTLRACVVMAALLAIGPAVAVEKGLANKGQVLVEDNCAGCHAIGLTGDSPNADAPAFRTLSANYPVGDLAESLAEGIVSGHPEMPIFVFKPHDVDAIIAYLETIQAPAPEAQPE